MSTSHYYGQDKKIYTADQWDHSPSKKKKHLHVYHIRHGPYERKVKPDYSSSGIESRSIWARCKHAIFDLYVDSPLHRIVEHTKTNCLPLPLPSYQLRPVIFTLDLDRRCSSNQYATFYDEIFTALFNVRHEFIVESDPVHYISTADVIILNKASLKSANVVFSERFDAFVGQSADSLIIVTESIALVSDKVGQVFRNLYSRTSLKYVPLLVLLVNPIADTHDYNWHDRIASSERLLLREGLLQFGSLHIPHKVFLIRSTHTQEDVEHALYWLWRKSGTRDRKKLIPVSTSIAKKQRSSAAEKRRKASIITTRKSVTAGPLVHTRRKVRFDPVPLDLERRITYTESLDAIDDRVLTGRFNKPAKRKDVLRPTCSMSNTALVDVHHDHPDLYRDFCQLKVKYYGVQSFPNLASNISTTSFVFDETAKSLKTMKNPFEMTAVDSTEHKRLRSKFAKEEGKYMELRVHQRKLEEDQRILKMKTDLLLEKLKEANSKLLQLLPHQPTLGDYDDM